MSDGESARPELDRLQSWMQTVITHPGGIRSGVISPQARDLLDVPLADLEAVVAPSSTLTGAERLAIYSRSYHARLVQSFQAMFPALLHVLGEELFDRFAIAYLQRYPPRSYTLDHLADAFPRYLDETRPDAHAPPEERESWADFMVDLATLELAVLQVFDGPGLEGEAAPSAEQVRALTDEQLLSARPVPAPCLRLFAFRSPVHQYWLAARRGEDPPVPAAAASFVALSRKSYRVMVHDLSSEQHALLRGLDGTRLLHQALDRVAGERQGSGAGLPLARQWLSAWAGEGFFHSL
jgi:hypothetical protein